MFTIPTFLNVETTDLVDLLPPSFSWNVRHPTSCFATLRRVISEIALGSFSGLSQIQVGSSVCQAWLLSAVALPCCFFSLLTLFLGFALRHHTWVLEFFVRWKCDVKVLIFRPHSSCPWDALQTACTHCTLSPCGSLNEGCSPIVLDVWTLGPWLMSLFGKV